MTTMTRTATKRRGTIAQRAATPESHGRGSLGERRFQAQINPDERAGRAQPTRSGGPREHFLSGAQFKSASQRRGRQARRPQQEDD